MKDFLEEKPSKWRAGEVGAHFQQLFSKVTGWTTVKAMMKVKLGDVQMKSLK